MHVTQQTATKGSQKWMQVLVDQHPTSLNGQLRSAGALKADSTLTWRSPLQNYNWTEYRDASFLECLGLLEYASGLAAFWPRLGPQWDALATGTNQEVFLFEAKAHPLELKSKCSASSPESRNLIVESLGNTKNTLGVRPDADWLAPYYQYANRLAHLQFLRSKRIDAWLVFLYFTNATEMNGPASAEEWHPHQQAMYRHLGLQSAGGIPGVIDAYIDTRTL